MWGHNAHVSANSGNNEWYTPVDIIERARAVLGGFDLGIGRSTVYRLRLGLALGFLCRQKSLGDRRGSLAG